MSLSSMSAHDLDIIRRSLEATFHFFDWDFHTRLGVTPKEMRNLLRDWPQVDDTSVDSIAALAINNAMNDLLNGVGISDLQAQQLIGADRSELERVFRLWKSGRAREAAGVRSAFTSQAEFDETHKRTAVASETRDKATSLPRVMFDTNEPWGTEPEGFWLGFAQSRLDLEKIGDDLRDGLRVVIYMIGELEMEATLEFDRNSNVWVAYPFPQTIKHYYEP